MIGCLFFAKFNYIPYFAIKSVAQSVQCFSAYGFAFFDSVQSVGRKALLKNQIIFCNPFFKKCIIKRFVRYHFYHHKNIIILNLLTMRAIEESNLAAIGLLVMLLGPIAVRIIFEVSMLTVLGVKNIIEINQKLDKKLNSKTATPVNTTNNIKTSYCGHCGTLINSEERVCPNCNKPI